MSNIDTDKAICLAEQHKTEMADLGYHPSRKEVGQHVWHNMSVDDRAEIMETVGDAPTIHRRYSACIDYVTEMVG